MRKYFFFLLSFLIPSSIWAVDPGNYTDPSQLPAAFTWNMTRYDYYATGPNAEQRLVRTQNIVVDWDPSYQNNSGSYGKLTINNFYDNDRLSNVCNLTFDNINHNCNFQWNEDKTICTFSLTPFYFSTATTSGLSGVYNSANKYALINCASYKTNGSRYWITPSYVNSSSNWAQTNYYYSSGMPMVFTLNISEKSLKIENSAWGVFMCQSESGASPSYVLEYYVNSVFVCTDTDLVDIIRDKEEGGEVTVSDDLLCVEFLPQYSYDNNGNKTYIGNVLVCKDLGKYENKNVNTADVFDYMKETGLFPSYDQSNWVVLTSNNYEPSTRDTYVGHILKGGTVKGTFTDKRNPTIALSEMPTPGDAMSYTPNVYVVPSFNDDYAATGSEFFFVQPKPQEYCQVMWATYDEDTDAFYVPTSEGNTNSHNLKGGFMWDKTYLDSGTASDEIVYNFHAMVNALPPTTESYNVWVHAINWNSELIEDENNFIYATVNGNKVFGEWPGKRLTHMRKAYDGYGTQSNWYYVSFGTTKPDLIIFSRGGSNQTGNITDFEKDDNFYNYFMDGDQSRYERLIGCYVTPQSTPTTLRETGTPDVGSGVSSRYVVMPISLDYNSVITGVRNIDATLGAPVSVTYYNTMGIASSRPHTGINIVVSRYADGTVSTAKTIVARGR